MLLLLPLSVHSTNVYNNVHFQPDVVVGIKDTKMTMTPSQLSLDPCIYIGVCFFFFDQHVACGILVPWPRIETLQWKRGVLTTEPWEKSQYLYFREG